MLSREQFSVLFAASLAELGKAEDVTRRELRTISRNLLSGIHGWEDAMLIGDVQFINQVIPVLTPINRKVYVLFMKHFAGFHFDDKLNIFTKKSAKRYADAKKDAQEFLADPNNNMFSWADRHIEIAPKPFDEKGITKYIEGQLKKAVGAGKGQADVVRAVFAAGIKADVVVAIMAKMADEAEALAEERKANEAPF